MAESTVHASCVAINGQGILITGPSGAGKSCLALQLIDQPGYGISRDLMPAQFVGDDQIALIPSNDELFAAAAPGLEGLLEIRGLGIVRLAYIDRVPLKLVVRLGHAGPLDRLPAPETLTTKIHDVALPAIRLDGAENTWAAVVRAALTALCDGKLHNN